MFSSLSFVLIFLAGLISAQFNFFDGMFRHQEQHQPSGASQWAAHSEGISCNRYLCPSTLECVKAPRECPCPNVEDIKCTIPDANSRDGATVLCVRGENECADVERLSKKQWM
ncbi:hypothetical protein DFS33DRAFT_615942 [Desarmillaria ectypa]|nr:hypothetical protein DFS33DRAFT_615942 [Desarmillaria ectypa]